MRDLMIDIETMGNGNNAAMIQLAGAYFNTVTGEIGETFNKCIDLEDCVHEGFKVDKSTADWWATQDQTILNRILDNGCKTSDVISEFGTFVRKAKRVWSHATFDFVIVQNYLKKFNIKAMPYRGAMDIRTLCYLSEINLSDYDWGEKTHDALDDCKFQIKYCVDALNTIKNNSEKAWKYDGVCK